MLPAIIGGVGLFILGMILLTDGLRALAGDALRSILERFVRGPISGLAWGAGITAIVQSSSATTLMTIGFVSAGLLSFTQSIGVIFGANIGTTSTGWIVSAIGLKFSMSQIALPIIGIGVVVRLLGGERIAPLGTALAGFGLIFVGIDTLQSGMETLAQRIDPATFPGMTILGIPALIVIGAVMTVVMQSSSAAVATTLAALHTHAITLDQAAVLVIGQNIGTSVKAILASIGASIPARRTAIAHVVFNVLTAIVALILLPLFLWFARQAGEGSDFGEDDAVALAAFHTGFNIVGVMILLPFTARFAALVMRIAPEPLPALTRNLDPSVVAIPSVAVEAARRSLIEITRETVQVFDLRFQGKETRAGTAKRLTALEDALREAQKFLSRLAAEASRSYVFERQLSAFHAADHLTRLLAAFRQERAIPLIQQTPSLERLAKELAASLSVVLAALPESDDDRPASVLGAVASSIAEARRRGRARLLEETATGKLSPHASEQLLEAHMWLDRMAYHVWRAAHHLGRKPVAEAEAEPSHEA